MKRVTAGAPDYFLEQVYRGEIGSILEYSARCQKSRRGNGVAVEEMQSHKV